MNELARWDPLQPLTPFGESVFDMIPTFWPARASAWQGPRLDVAESDTAYQLAVELPGIRKEAIQVSVYENSVTISAEASREQAEEQQWLVRERSFGKFSRTLNLPEAVDDSASQARYVDGVLYLTLQKKRASQIRRLAVH